MKKIVFLFLFIISFFITTFAHSANVFVENLQNLPSLSDKDGKFYFETWKRSVHGMHDKTTQFCVKGYTSNEGEFLCQIYSFSQVIVNITGKGQNPLTGHNFRFSPFHKKNGSSYKSVDIRFRYTSTGALSFTVNDYGLSHNDNVINNKQVSALNETCGLSGDYCLQYVIVNYLCDARSIVDGCYIPYIDVYDFNGHLTNSMRMTRAFMDESFSDYSDGFFDGIWKFFLNIDQGGYGAKIFEFSGDDYVLLSVGHHDFPAIVKKPGDYHFSKVSAQDAFVTQYNNSNANISRIIDGCYQHAPGGSNCYSWNNKIALYVGSSNSFSRGNFDFPGYLLNAGTGTIITQKINSVVSFSGVVGYVQYGLATGNPQNWNNYYGSGYVQGGLSGGGNTNTSFIQDIVNTVFDAIGALLSPIYNLPVVKQIVDLIKDFLIFLGNVGDVFRVFLTSLFTWDFSAFSSLFDTRAQVICDNNYNYTGVKTIDSKSLLPQGVLDQLDGYNGFDSAFSLLNLFQFASPVPPAHGHQICTYLGVKTITYTNNSWIDIILVMIFSSTILLVFYRRND